MGIQPGGLATAMDIPFGPGYFHGHTFSHFGVQGAVAPLARRCALGCGEELHSGYFAGHLVWYFSGTPCVGQFFGGFFRAVHGHGFITNDF